jgi:hypothetical protein
MDVSCQPCRDISGEKFSIDMVFRAANPSPTHEPSACDLSPDVRRSPFLRAAAAGLVWLAIGDVHRDFHAEPEINRSRGFPFHVNAPVGMNCPGTGVNGALLLAAMFRNEALGRNGMIMKLGS